MVPWPGWGALLWMLAGAARGPAFDRRNVVLLYGSLPGGLFPGASSGVSPYGLLPAT